MSYCIWTVVGNVIYLVNSIVWAGNMGDPWRFWCDLTTKLMVGLSVGLPVSSLIINRRLYTIATIRQVNVSRSDSRKSMWIEAAIAIGFPVIIMILHVVVQGHRYDVIENVGCWPATYVTPVTIPLLLVWPIILGMISLVYASLSIWAFLKQRKQFSDVLQSANSGLNVSRYFRLMALAATEIIFSLPLSTYTMVTNLSTDGLHPWISWANTHFDFNRTEYVPFGIFQLYPSGWILVNISRYSIVAAGFFFFGYLGLSGESGNFYRKHFWGLVQKCGLPGPTDTAAGASWVARPGASGPGQLRSLPPFATTASFSSSTAKKDAPSLDLYPIPSARVKAHSSSSDSLSLPPDLEDETGESSTHDEKSPTSFQHDLPVLPNVHYSTAEVSSDVV